MKQVLGRRMMDIQFGTSWLLGADFKEFTTQLQIQSQCSIHVLYFQLCDKHSFIYLLSQDKSPSFFNRYVLSSYCVPSSRY